MPAGRPTVMRDASILIPYAQNNKKHPQGQIDHIKKSIDEYGWMQPLVLDKNDVVVVGHGRLLAAMEMGIEEVPCVIADDLTEEQVRKYRLLDNKLSDLGEYDMEAVQMEIELLNDLELATLFDIDLTPENEVNEEEEDTVPEDPKIIVVEKGDVFQL